MVQSVLGFRHTAVLKTFSKFAETYIAKSVFMHLSHSHSTMINFILTIKKKRNKDESTHNETRTLLQNS